MLFGKPPFFGYSIPLLIRDVKKRINNIEFPKEVSEESKDLIKKLLKKDPKERISW